MAVFKNEFGEVDVTDEAAFARYIAAGWQRVGGADKPFPLLTKAELIEFGNSKFGLGLEGSLSKAELVELIEAAQAE